MILILGWVSLVFVVVICTSHCYCWLVENCFWFCPSICLSVRPSFDDGLHEPLALLGLTKHINIYRCYLIKICILKNYFYVCKWSSILILRSVYGHIKYKWYIFLITIGRARTTRVNDLFHLLFQGFVRIMCYLECNMEYHLDCWKKRLVDDFNRCSDKVCLCYLTVVPVLYSHPIRDHLFYIATLQETTCL